MATRGRKNANKSKISSVKTAVQKHKGGLLQTGIDLVSGVVHSKASKKGTGAKMPRTTAQLLKRAYDRKARVHIRTGNLGQARRLLRKKRTVI